MNSVNEFVVHFEITKVLFAYMYTVRSLWATQRVAKERTIAIYQNIDRAAVVIVDDVSLSHVFTGDVGSHIQ